MTCSILDFGSSVLDFGTRTRPQYEEILTWHRCLWLREVSLAGERATFRSQVLVTALTFGQQLVTVVVLIIRPLCNEKHGVCVTNIPCVWAEL